MRHWPAALFAIVVTVLVSSSIARPVAVSPQVQSTIRSVIPFDTGWRFSRTDAGVRVPTGNAEVTFEVQGPLRLLGIGNGDLSDASPALDATHRVFQGRGLAVFQTTGAAGPVSIRASSPGLPTATVTITVWRRPS